DESAGAPVAEIAGIEPAVGAEDALRLRLVVEVSFHDRGAAHEDAPDDPLGQRASGRVAYLDLDVRQGPAAEDQLSRTRRARLHRQRHDLVALANRVGAHVLGL